MKDAAETEAPIAAGKAKRGEPAVTPGRPGSQLVIEGDELRQHAVCQEYAADLRSSGFAQTPARFRIAFEATEVIGEGGGIAGGKEQPGTALINDLSMGRNVGNDAGKPEIPCLDDIESQRLRCGSGDQDVGGVAKNRPSVVTIAEEMHSGSYPGSLNLSLEAAALFAAAHDYQMNIPGLMPQCRDRDVDRLSGDQRADDDGDQCPSRDAELSSQPRGMTALQPGWDNPVIDDACCGGWKAIARNPREGKATHPHDHRRLVQTGPDAVLERGG